jgi:hypothetical protein
MKVVSLNIILIRSTVQIIPYESSLKKKISGIYNINI